MWDEQGNKLPPRYGIATAAERAKQPGFGEPAAVLADRHVAAARALAETARTNAAAQEAGAAALTRAVEAGDAAAAKAAVDAMWQQIYLTYKSLQALELAWNELTLQAPGSVTG
jgi:hypothetical protein